MTTQQILTIFSVLEIINLVALVILWLLPAPECTCRECVYHRDREAVDKERKRVKAHRDHHSPDLNGNYIPWGPDHCRACRDGGEGDRP